VALLMKTVREPLRTALGNGTRAAVMPVREVVAYLRALRGAYGYSIAGFAAASLLWNGAQAWIPTFFYGGFLGGWYAKRGHIDADLRVGVLSAALVLPAGLLAPQLATAEACLAAFAAFCFLNLAGIGLGPTVVALCTDLVFHDDLAVGRSIVAVAAVAAPLSMLLLWLGLKPFRRCIDTVDF
jgi:hypothetical protein